MKRIGMAVPREVEAQCRGEEEGGGGDHVNAPSRRKP
jgi:hypothetical protein